MKVKVTIVGEYEVVPAQFREYDNPASAAEAAAVDQGQYDMGVVGLQDVLSWIEGTAEVTIEGVA